ncbi:histidinol dehydrogenase [Alicyclobacillus curvatus]|nr:histidinol dehydrogenase [Alicyclobacillus curvatus]
MFQWQRTSDSDDTAMAAVQEILTDVKQRGDEAIRHWTAKLDYPGADDGGFRFRVSPAAMESAWNALDRELQAALQAASNRIRRFHESQLHGTVEISDAEGAVLGLVWRPIRRVGVYAPGGRAAYPSTVLMNLIPAQVAGVSEMVLVSPPQRETGLPHPHVLAAAHLLGVTEMYALGGAQAIAALAYGTESIQKVDKLAGPGNLYVALAKRAVMGDVGVDSIAGPSEVFIVADETANPNYIAADMLAQAEHDPEAGAVCVTTVPELADAIEAALTHQLSVLPKREVAEAALTKWGAIVTAHSLAEALEVVNRSAPEHVELLVDKPEEYLDAIHQAGAVFLGAFTPEPVGDYYAGSNHVLPTHGTARFASGLGVADFLRRMSYVSYKPETLRAHGSHIMTLARAEGLDAHAESIAIRLDEMSDITKSAAEDA